MRIIKKARTWAFCACLVCTLSSATLTGCGKANDSRKTEVSAEETTDINVMLITNVLECSNEDGEKIWEALKAEGAKEIDMIGYYGGLFAKDSGKNIRNIAKTLSKFSILCYKYCIKYIFY